jgi:hypothetical protein
MEKNNMKYKIIIHLDTTNIIKDFDGASYQLTQSIVNFGINGVVEQLDNDNYNYYPPKRINFIEAIKLK